MYDGRVVAERKVGLYSNGPSAKHGMRNENIKIAIQTRLLLILIAYTLSDFIQTDITLHCIIWMSEALAFILMSDQIKSDKVVKLNILN